MKRPDSDLVTAKAGVAATIALAWPVLMGSAALAVLEFVERLCLGNYSESALAASLPGTMLATTFTLALGNTIGYSGAFVAQFHGAGQGRKSVSALFQGLWLAAFSIPAFLALIPLGQVLIDAVGHAESVRTDEMRMFVCHVFAGIASTFSGVLGGYFSGLGRTRIVGLATVLGCCAGLLLNPLLIFGCRLGVVGAGISSVAAFATSAAILGGCVARDPRVRLAWISGHCAFSPPLAGRIFRLGLPFGLSLLVSNGVFTLFLSVFGRFGMNTLALGNACFTIHNLIYYAVSSLATAAFIQTGYFAGQENPDAVRRILRIALGLACGACVAFYAVVIPFARQMLSAFGFAAAGETVTTGIVFLSLMAVRDLGDTVQSVYAGGLRGIGDTRFILFAKVIVYGFVWTPLFLFVAHNAISFWATMSVSFILFAVILRCRWRNQTCNLASPLTTS